MKDVQDFVKEINEEKEGYKRLVFLTSAQSVPEMSNNDWENSMTPSSDECCNDTSDWSPPTDSIFTDDLQLNWSAFTPKQTEKMKEKIYLTVRKLFISYESNGVKLLCDIFHTR